jgi:signal-transduction protein with cAMP-binding, CBS, and nucleotidyltransferase domain
MIRAISGISVSIGKHRADANFLHNRPQIAAATAAHPNNNRLTTATRRERRTYHEVHEATAGSQPAHAALGGPDDSVFSALELMAKHDIGAVLVMRDGQLAGIFSERDYARKVILLGKSSKEMAVKEIMTEKVLYALPEQTVDQAMALMTDKHIRHLPVLDANKKVVGHGLDPRPARRHHFRAAAS